MILIRMRKPVRLIPFLILNVIVSAVTVLVVLNWWNSTRPPAPLAPVIFPTETVPTQTLRATPTALPGESRPLQVVDVIGTGDLKNEVVQLKNISNGELRLGGWKVEDNQGHRFTFPNYTLGKDGTVRIITRGGLDTATDLYWGLAEAVWQSGKTVAVYDQQDNLRASFKVP